MRAHFFFLFIQSGYGEFIHFSGTKTDFGGEHVAGWMESTS